MPLPGADTWATATAGSAVAAAVDRLWVSSRSPAAAATSEIAATTTQLRS